MKPRMTEVPIALLVENIETLPDSILRWVRGPDLTPEEDIAVANEVYKRECKFLDSLAEGK